MALSSIVSRNIKSVGFSTMVSVLSLLSVPWYLLHFGSGADYKCWILISALLSLISILDLGFGDASANSYILSEADSKLTARTQFFDSCRFYIHWVIFVSVLAIICAVLLLSSAGYQSYILTAVLIGLANTAYSMFMVPYAFMRISGNFSRYQRQLATSRLIELIGMFITFYFSHSVNLMSASLLAIRIVTIAFFQYRLRCFTEIYNFKFEKGSNSHFAQSVMSPILGNSMMSIANYMRNQGILLLLAKFMSAESLLTYALIRTYLSGARQILDAILSAIQPILTEKSRSGKLLSSDFLSKFTRIYFMTAVILFASSLIVGEKILNFWSSGKIEFHFQLLLIVGIFTFIDSLLLYFIGILVSQNKQIKLVILHTIASLVNCLLVFTFGHNFSSTQIFTLISLTSLLTLPIYLLIAERDSGYSLIFSRRL